MIKYVMRNPDNNALLNNKQFDTLEQAILYAKNDNCWIDEVKVGAYGRFKSTEKVCYSSKFVQVDKSLNNKDTKLLKIKL